MTRHKPPKILVVDDDARLRDLLRRYLGDNGYAVFVADSAQTMNRLWQRERYDLLILDLMMPGEDGLSIMRRLRGGNDQTPIIMLTAKGEDVDRIVGLEMGADDYLPKPFSPRELLARIKSVLRRARSLPGRLGVRPRTRARAVARARCRRSYTAAGSPRLPRPTARPAPRWSGAPTSSSARRSPRGRAARSTPGSARSPRAAR